MHREMLQQHLIIALSGQHLYDRGPLSLAASRTARPLPEIFVLVWHWGRATHPDPSSPTPRLEPLGRNRVKSGDRREKWNAFGTLLSSRIRLVSSHFACCKRFASSRSCPTIAVRRRWTALARSGYLIRDPANLCQPTAYLCPKAEDGNRRKSVLQRARQRSG
jgi:hypothetical protein